MTVEQNIESLQPKLKQRMYDYFYKFEKDVRDAFEIQKMDTHEEFLYWDGNKSKLLKLPSWCRKYVIYFDDSGDGVWNDRYTLRLERLPEDPESKITKSTITFHADSLRELKSDLERYRKSVS